MRAQTAGEGTIQGTVTDGTGAAVPNATITATNVGTNVTTVRTSTDSGLFNISPLPPGRYSLKIEASGFKTMEQSNLVVNALQVLTFNPSLAIGETSETVVVTAAPPILNQSNATLGLTIENETYSNLPLQTRSAIRPRSAR
ncbi:MAG TPA: carboxypeptidase-like regulatory domain-containing protein [Edaphobacter sp.]|nr:carboxypeptidase-like regulatory domain-containing protein [Edaphobacter sp.]